MSYRIEPAGQEHARAITAIHNSHVIGESNENGFFLRESKPDAIEKTIKDPTNLALVCLSGQEVVGYLIATHDVPELEALNWHEQGIASMVRQSILESRHLHVSQVAARQDIQGAGIGGELYSQLIMSRSDYIVSAYVATRPMNQRSLKFHQRHGFAEVATFRASEFMGLKHYESRLMVKN